METQNSDESITKIYLINKRINSFDILPEWENVIRKFDIVPLIFKYNDYFELDYLKSLLTDDSEYNVINISTKFNHYIMNSSKRKFIGQGNAKISDILEYVNKLKNKKIIFHGTSGVLKNLVNNLDSKSSIIVQKLLKDEEIIEIFSKEENSKNLLKLEEWLNKILHKDYSKKIVYGKDLNYAIANMQIKTIFCNELMAKKIDEIIPNNLKIFELIIVKSYGDDSAKTLETNFKGIIGIKFY